MKLFALVYQEHYAKYCERHTLSQTDSSFQDFLKEIGTPSLSFQPRKDAELLKDVSYNEVPPGSCIRLRLQGDYVGTVHKKLFEVSYEKADKSERGNSCSIV